MNIFFTRIIIIYTLITGFSTAIARSEEDLQLVTKNKIFEDFKTHNIEWIDKIHIKIQGLSTSKNTIPFIEGETVRGKFLYLNKKSFKKSQIKMIGVYLDGNRKPLVALVTPGDSFSTKVISVNAKADRECGAIYKYIVVIKTKYKTIANKLRFRTTIGDCGGNVNG